MKGKKLSTYAFAVVFFLLGVAATLLILNVSERAQSMEGYETINPSDLNADFERGQKSLL